jgi:hypothetical protein
MAGPCRCGSTTSGRRPGFTALTSTRAAPLSKKKIVTVFIGDQDDRELAEKRYVATRCRKFDIILDDGGHTMSQQINTFEELYGST